MESMETSETIEQQEQQEPQAAESREDTAPETVAPEPPASETAAALESMAAEELLPGVEAPPDAQATEDARLKALLEAVVYVTEEPLTLEQLAHGVAQPRERVEKLLEELVAGFEKHEHGVTIRVVAGSYKMATKPEHHESVRAFVKSLKPPLKLSLPALETLAVVAYKQPVTAPEIMEIRGVQGAGVLKTLLDRKLIAVAGRKNVIGKPILYKTTKEFLIQFGLKDLSELPSLKEFEEIRRMAISDSEMTLPLEPMPEEQPAGPQAEASPQAEPAPEPEQEPEPAAAEAQHSQS
jgi:segregation and condensation protein B